jgi:hypothetical protein
MSTIRDSLQYHQSPYTVTDHAAEADAILEACAQEFPKLLPFLLEPSNLLVLGGMRAVSPYVTFGSHDRMANSPEFAAMLQRFGLCLIREEANYGPASEQPVYLLIHTGAFEALRDQYHAVQTWWAPKPKVYDRLNYTDWYTYNMLECEMQFENGKLPEQWLANWWAPHHLCFGMLLGYPGAAICSLVTSDMVYKQLGVPPRMEEITFNYPENNGAPVSYDVQKTDAGSKQITAHRKRWQSFFDMIYETWPHDRVKSLSK